MGRDPTVVSQGEWVGGLGVGLADETSWGEILIGRGKRLLDSI